MAPAGMVVLWYAAGDVAGDVVGDVARDVARDVAGDVAGDVVFFGGSGRVLSDLRICRVIVPIGSSNGNELLQQSPASRFMFHCAQQ